MNFYPGQRVVCIDVDGAPQLKLKAIYTIKEITGPATLRWRGNVVCGFAVYLHETEPHASYTGFAADRFRPIQERVTDISIFTEMLIDTKLDIDA